MTFVKPPGEGLTPENDEIDTDKLQVPGEAEVAAMGKGTLGAKIDKIGNLATQGVEVGALVKAVAKGDVGAVKEIAQDLLQGKAAETAGKILPLPNDLPGGFAGPIGGGIAGIAGKVSPVMSEAELPVFEEKAITSSVSKRAVSTFQAPGAGIGGGIGGAVANRLGGKNLELSVSSGDGLDVRNFSIHERLSSLYQVNLVAVSENPSIDFDAVVGQPARFAMHGDHQRFWSGLCNHFELVRVEPSGLSTYQLSIVPPLWLLTQRKNHRMFQQISEPDIVLKVLKEWGIEPVVRIDKGAYKKRKYRVQYGESDFAFISRMLEDAGISYAFEQHGEETKLVLCDAPQANPKRGAAIPFMDDASMAQKAGGEFVTHVRMGQRVRPGKYTMRDHDYRRPPSYKLMQTAAGGKGIEEKLERFQYTPGAFLFGSDQGESTPVADDKGKTRTDEKEAQVLAQKRLDAKRGSARVATFETNAHDLAPGVVMSIGGHPHAALGDGKALLVVESSVSGTDRGEWSHHCEVRGTEIPFRPELSTPKPTVNGVESATVVGPKGEEIHVDEFGRVRVHFHWDRESKMDDNSSCWIHVSQPWGGAGYGGTSLPRVGQEVLVDFLGGDPDRPVIVGRVYTNLQKTPYKLPENKTQSGWKSNSTGGGGGYNEIMFEDAAGKELVNIQAQKDLNKLVKNNETETTGVNRTISVGKDRSVTVGQNDTSFVGKLHSTTIVPPPPPGGMGPPAPATTVFQMIDKEISHTTGQAAIILKGSDITLAAEGSIVLAAKQIVQIDGTDAVYINCTAPPPSPIEESQSSFLSSLLLPAALAMTCPPLFAAYVGFKAVQAAISLAS